MSSFDEQWGTAAVGDNDEPNDPPADGDYTVTLVKGKAFTSAKEEDWVVLELRELATAHEWSVMLGFRSQGQANVTKTACSKLGLAVDEIGSLSELNTQLEALEGGYFDVTVKTSPDGKYHNTYIEGPSVGTDVPVPQEELVTAAVTDDDDVPF